MPGSKKKKPHAQTRVKTAMKRAAAKKPQKKSPQPAKKVGSAKAKKVVAKRALGKKLPAKTRPTGAPRSAPASEASPARPSKAFAEKVRDCDAATGIWFITAGSVEHAAIQRRGGDGAVVIRTDAGMTEVVPLSNLFETADEARAARYR
jgi:hypothetical protein